MTSELEELRERLAVLEARVADLEAPRPRAAGGSAAGDAGSVRYAGTVRLAGEVRWTIELGAEGVLALPPAAVVRVLAALGHPVRLAVVRRLLRGPASVAELQEAVGGSSAGQVYHHLSTLAAAGVAEAVGGGRHRVPPTAVVPLLVGLLAAADVGGVLA
ncbi:MAG TPA: helix-turn-helix domain-containing protein [Geodermatophilus sp.]|nr:helix-turn-helix domain-containing protein [Geodermatophilus sp.]